MCVLALRVGASPEREDFLLSRWQTDDGLPQSCVSSIQQTHDGFLWIGTFGGLVCFDGRQFDVHTVANTQGLPANYVRCLYEDSKGALWIGCDRGSVGRMQDGIFSRMLLPVYRTERTDWVSSIAEDDKGGIWVGFSPDCRASRWDGERWQDFREAEGLPAGSGTYVYRETSGALWAVTPGGCAVFRNGRFISLEVKPSDDLRLAPAHRGGMWMVHDGALKCIDATGAARVETRLDTIGPSIGIRAMHEDTCGAVWLATRGGLFRWGNGILSRVFTSHAELMSVTEDREGNLWVGTDGDGLNRLRARRFEILGNAHGLGSDAIASICRDTDGAIWIAPRESRVARFFNGSLEYFGEPEVWPARSINTLCAARDGEVWIGTDGNGVWRLSAGRFASVALHDQRISALVEAEGSLWIGTLRGSLFRMFEGKLTEYPSQDGMIMINALAYAHNEIWVGTERGALFRGNDKGFQRVAIPGESDAQSIATIVEDPRDGVWVGTFQGGLLRVSDRGVQRLGIEHGLPDGDVRQVAMDEGRRFWVGTPKGLFSMLRSDVDAVLDGRATRFTSCRFGRADGLDSVDFVRGFSNTSLIERNGRIWMASNKGAVSFLPQQFEQGGVLVSATIQAIQAEGKLTALRARSREFELVPNPKRIEISFTAPTFSAPERVRFRYALDPIEHEWTEAVANRAASYSRLPPGTYEFRVAASMDGVVWQAEPTRLSITIPPALHQTALFQGAMALGGIVVTAGIARMVEGRRMRRRMERLEHEHAIERERARIARDMHDDVGSRVTRIALLSELAIQEEELPAEGRRRIAEIADSARDVSAALDQIVWTVNPSNDSLSRIVGYFSHYAEEYLQHSGLTLEFDLPETVAELPVPSTIRHELLLAFKEALNNVVKHSKSSSVRVAVKVAGETLEVSVIDRGRGFSAGNLRVGNGLGNMKRRLFEAGGVCEIESVAGEGTAVRFRLSLESSTTRS